MDANNNEAVNLGTPVEVAASRSSGPILSRSKIHDTSTEYYKDEKLVVKMSLCVTWTHMAEWRYSSAHSQTLHQMRVSNEVQAQVAFFLGEQPRIATEKEATWVQEPILILWRREKSLSPARNWKTIYSVFLAATWSLQRRSLQVQITGDDQSSCVVKARMV